MFRKWKKFLLVCLFFVCAGLVFLSLSSVLTEKEAINEMILQDYKDSLEEPVDVYVLGSSHVRSVSGARMLKEHGIRLYSVGTAGQPWMATAYLADEILKKNKPDLLVLNTSSLFVESDAGFLHLVFDEEKDFIKRARFILNNLGSLNENEKIAPYDIAGLVFPLLFYHHRWNEVTADDFYGPATERVGYYGAPVSFVRTPYSRSDFVLNGRVSNNTVIYGHEVNFLYDIIAKCRDKGVEILLMQTPSARWNQTKHDIAQKIAQENDLAFLDFNDPAVFDQCGLDAETDFHDNNHLNIYGSIKLTDMLGEFIVEHYDVSTEDLTARDSDALGKFEMTMNTAVLRESQDPDEIFGELAQDGCVVLVQMNGESYGNLKETYLSWLTPYGLDTGAIDDDALNFLCVLTDGKVVYSESSSESISYKDKFPDGRPFKIYSDLNRNADPVMKIDDERLKFSGHGLNILAYDPLNGKIIRTFTMIKSDGNWLML